MILSLMTNYFVKKERGRIRSHIRSYNKLKNENKLDLIYNIKNQFTNTPINGAELLSIIDNPIELCYHQLLIFRLLNIKFHKVLLISFGSARKKITYALPKEWRKVLITNGFKINHFKCQLLWIIFQFKWYLIGVATAILELKKGLCFIKTPYEPYAYFENLSQKNLPKNNFKLKNVITWFLEQDEASNISTIVHNVSQKKNPEVFNKVNFYNFKGALPPLDSANNYLSFLIWFIFYSVKSLFTAKKRILLREKVFLKISQKSSNDKLARMYFFHNSTHLLRPLWTYEVEKKGSEVIFYFYSTNIFSFKESNSDYLQDGQWQIVNWPNYWVWNQTQKYFIENVTISKSKISLKGVIPFSSLSCKNIEVPKTPYILVFDVQPVKDYIYCTLGAKMEYYNVKNSIIFLSNIDKLSKQFGFNVMFKRKRNSNIISKPYLRKVTELMSNTRWEEINPEIDASSLFDILTPFAVISMPYTSTSVIASNFNIPSVYFDATCKLDPDFFAKNDLPFISGYNELKEWLMCLEKKL